MPIGNTMIHLGNSLCLIAALLLGGIGGGIAGGVGMALFDVSSAAFAVYAPFTFIQKFLAGFVCGKIAYMKGKNGESFKYNAVGAALGGLVNLIFAQINAVIVEHFIMGSNINAVFISNMSKLPVNIINMFIAVIVSLLISTPVRYALEKHNIKLN